MKRSKPSRWRWVPAALFFLLFASGLVFHSGWGTASVFGWKEIASVCPLGALESLAAGHSLTLRAALGFLGFALVCVVFGRVFCGWVCPVPLARRVFGVSDTADSLKEIPRAEKESGASESGAAAGSEPPRSGARTAACGAAGEPEKRASCGEKESCGGNCAACASFASGKKEGKLEKNSPFIVLAGALAGSAIFGFPVFCLVCPVGLTFALCIGLWRLFGFNEASWSILFFAGFLILEIFVLRRWCHQFCPIGAVITLISRCNRFFRPHVDESRCVKTSTGAECRRCRSVCSEEIDLHHLSAADLARCLKCHACADACPAGAISFPVFAKKGAPEKAPAFEPAVRKDPEKIPASERVRNFNEITAGFSAEDALIQSGRCILCGECEKACPQGNPIPEVMKLLSEGKNRAAGLLLLQPGAMPEICGRVCPKDRLCESVCPMARSGGAVPIGALNRFAADLALGKGWRPKKTQQGLKAEVAVVGAGPSGLAFADSLARRGVSVTVFDRMPEIGGLLTFGIPSFKLDKSVVRKRRALCEREGVKFELGKALGRDFSLESLKERFAAVYVAVGATSPVPLPAGTEPVPGVISALSYLEGCARHRLGAEPGEAPYVNLSGKRVIVLGGGDTAMDCVRTALRDGAASAECVYRGPAERMRASADEIENAREEGALFRYGSTAESFGAEAGKLSSVTLLEKSADGERRETVPADAVIVAFGYRNERVPFLSAIQDEAGRVETDGLMATRIPGVFAGGEAVHGADLVTTAVRDGRRAADAVFAYLKEKKAEGKAGK